MVTTKTASIKEQIEERIEELNETLPEGIKYRARLNQVQRVTSVRNEKRHTLEQLLLPTASSPQSQVQQAAAVLAETGKFPDGLTGQSDPPSAEVTKCRREIRVADTALLYDLAPKVAAAKSERDRAVCAQLEPEFKNLAQAIGTKVVEIGELFTTAENYFEALRSADISYASWLPFILFRGLGNLQDENSNIRRFLKELARDYPGTEFRIPTAHPVVRPFTRSNGSVPKVVTAAPTRKRSVDSPEWTLRA